MKALLISVGVIYVNGKIYYSVDPDLVRALHNEYQLGDEIDVETHSIELFDTGQWEGNFVICPYSSDVDNCGDYTCNCDEYQQEECSWDI